MKLNMSTADRITRLVIAAVIGVLFYMKIITGTLGIVLAVVAAIFLITSIAGFCPLYALFGIKTSRTQ